MRPFLVIVLDVLPHQIVEVLLAKDQEPNQFRGKAALGLLQSRYNRVAC
jgi:hypothetical protein